MSEILDAISALGDAAADMTTAKESFEAVRQGAEQAISDHLTEDNAHNQYVKTDTFEQVKKLPIYPEVMSDDNRLNMMLENGYLIIEDDQIIRLYGWLEVNTSDYAVKSFPIEETKTYHLRFNLTDGFYLKDVSDVEYNPDSLDESDATFDTNYDDMNLALVYNGLLMRCIHTHQLSKTALLSGDGSLLVPVCPRLRSMRFLFSNLEPTGSDSQSLTVPASVELGGQGFFKTNSSTTIYDSYWTVTAGIVLDTNNNGNDTSVCENTIAFSPRLQRFQTNQWFTELHDSNTHEFLLRSERGACLPIWQTQGMSLNYLNIVSANITVEYLR